MKKECEKYQMDMVDYATGETTFLTKAKQQKLFEHLRTCEECRSAFFDYEKIYAIAVSDEKNKRPEFRQKMEELMKKFKDESKPACQPGKGRQLIDVKSEVGDLSGLLWKILAKHGELPEAELHRHLNTSLEMAHQALGWLERENKVLKIKDTKGVLVCLTEAERLQYRPQAGANQTLGG